MALALTASSEGALADAVPAASWSPSPIPAFLRAFGTREPAIAQSNFGIAPALPSDPAVAAVQADFAGLSFTAAAPRPARSLSPAPGLLPPTGLLANAGGAGTDASGPVQRPGLSGGPLDLPSYFLREKTVAPHIAPDIEIGLDARTSLGLYGDVSHTNREDIRNNTVREGRDVGAGVTLQYKFDSR